jgi:hypothetical protein
VAAGKDQGPFRPALSASLRAHLEGRMRDDAARNHWTHAKAATEALQALVKEDADARQLAAADIKIFIAYAHEVLDRYGRPLVFANIDGRTAAKRPPTYNERMIATGCAAPLYIWPNIDPFRGMKVTDAAMPPQEFRRHVARSGSLQASRRAAAEARTAGQGHLRGRQSVAAAGVRAAVPGGPARPGPLGDRPVGGRGRSEPHREQPVFRGAQAGGAPVHPAEYVPLVKEKGWV